MIIEVEKILAERNTVGHIPAVHAQRPLTPDEAIAPGMFHPILMSQPMQAANLKGEKEVTRRVSGLKEINKDPERWQYMEIIENGKAYFYNKSNPGDEKYITCPYGKVGHYLWVRENFAYTQFVFDKGIHGKGEVGLIDSIIYQADKGNNDWDGKWKPSIHLPREGSRMTLQVKGIRIERLEDITSEQVFMEGIRVSDAAGHIGYLENPHAYIARFMNLWDSLHKKTGWDKDKKKFVWVINYKILKP